VSEISEKFLITIDGRVDDIAERLSSVEGKLAASTRTSPRKLIGELGGYAALIVSISVGVYTLYNNLVVQPVKERVQAEATFRSNMNALASINARMARAFSENPQAAAAEMASITPQRLALLDEIEKADAKMPHIPKFADRLLMAGEYQGFGKLSEALHQIDLAEAAANDGFQEANASWWRARLNGLMGNFSVMRDTFGQALNQLKALGLKKTAFDVLRLYTEWVATEINNGECSQARDVHAKMVQDFASPDVFPMTRVQIKQEFSAMLAQSAQSCGLSADLDAS
jgi:hypothetical protein